MAPAWNAIAHTDVASTVSPYASWALRSTTAWTTIPAEADGDGLTAADDAGGGPAAGGFGSAEQPTTSSPDTRTGTEARSAPIPSSW
jgi:hypothetical protein